MGPAGGFAELAVVPARQTFDVPVDLPRTFAALVEPFAVGLHGVHSAEISPGDDVLIVGAGGVGLTTLTWALEKGGVRLTVADPDPDRRETALAMGATDVLDRGIGSRDQAVTTPRSSAWDARNSCRRVSRRYGPQGRLVISGACAEPTYIEPVTALLKELTIRYSVAYCPDEFLEVIAAFARGVVDPSPMNGPTFGLHRLAEAFDTVREA